MIQMMSLSCGRKHLQSGSILEIPILRRCFWRCDRRMVELLWTEYLPFARHSLILTGFLFIFFRFPSVLLSQINLLMIDTSSFKKCNLPLIGRYAYAF